MSDASETPVVDLAWEEFIKVFSRAFSDKRFAELDRIAPSTEPIIVLRNPGLAVLGARYPSLSAALRSVQWNVELVHHPIKNLATGAFPVDDCAEKPSTARRMQAIYGRVRRIDHLLRWNESEVEFDSAADRELASSLSKRVTHFLYVQEGKFGFYFARTQHGWATVGFDMVVPCSL